MTISLYFADGVLEEVSRIRFSDFRITVQKKAEVIMLHGHGLGAEQIAAIMNMSVSTIWNYLNEFDKRPPRRERVIFCGSDYIVKCQRKVYPLR